MRIDDISHIDGSWIKSAKNIEYHNEQLCANLLYKEPPWNLYAYKNSCIDVKEQIPVKLKNENGKFEIDDKNNSWSHSMRFPDGLWFFGNLNPKYVQFFPGVICIQSNEFSKTHYYMQCVDYFDKTQVYFDSGTLIVYKVEFDSEHISEEKKLYWIGLLIFYTIIMISI